MAALRNLLNRIAGIDDDRPRALQVCAFGKHPASTEFIELNTGEGAAHLVEQWIKHGHDEWIRNNQQRQRGKVVPVGFMAKPPDIHPQRVVACMWPSRDSASPARVFPLCLFTILKGDGDAGWAEQFVLTTHLCNALSAVYRPVQNTADISSLRTAVVEVSTQQITTLQTAIAERSKAIDSAAWLAALAPTARCSSAEQFHGLLHERLAVWRGDPGDLAIRLPLSRLFDFAAQGLTWIRWLAGHFGRDCPPLTAVYAPPNESAAVPTLALSTRQMAASDFQLMTSDASEYAFFESLVAGESMPDERPVPPNQSTWSWSDLSH